MSSDSCISVVTLKFRRSALIKAESHLKARGWRVSSFTDYRVALSAIVQTRPDFVIICGDHPERVVRAVPKILINMFGIPVITYFESQPNHEAKLLEQIGVNHSVPSSVDGSLLEVIILKSFENAKGNVSAEMRSQGVDAIQRLLLSEGLPKGDAFQIETERAKVEAVGPISSSKGDEFQIDAERAEVETTQPDNSFASKDKAPPKWIARNTTWISPKSSLKPDSLLVKGLRQAISSSAIPAVEPVKTLETTTHLSCVIVDSTHFKGYLIAAMAGTQAVEGKFVETVRRKLEIILEHAGERIDGDGPIPLRVAEVPFEEWALAHAEFMSKSVNGYEEVVMAFFPVAHRLSLETTPDDKMYKVALTDLDPTEMIEFDMFIHMPVNEKYVLYTSRGGYIHKDQKERLLARGITHVHVLKDSRFHVQKHRAQHFVNTLINEFNSNKETKDTKQTG